MIDLTCVEVVPLIARSGPQLELVVSRRPTDVQLTKSPAASADIAASKQFHIVVDEGSLDRNNMKEDDV